MPDESPTALEQFLTSCRSLTHKDIRHPKDDLEGQMMIAEYGRRQLIQDNIDANNPNNSHRYIG